MRILIKNGHVVDPVNKINGLMDVLVDGAVIAQVAAHIDAAADSIIDASGKMVIPGLVDMHVHLREPGREDKETVLTGTKAALKGGVTSVLAMPNTTPACDSVDAVRRLKDIIAKTAQNHVFMTAAITKGRAGTVITDIAVLKNEGVVAITDDGCSVDDLEVMREALKKAKESGLVTICHCEDKTLVRHGVINLGFVATQLGLRGISCASEYKRVERDIELASQTQGRIHIAHVSCKESVALIASAKKNKVRVTAETAPHYFSLSEDVLMGYDTNFKMNPPLRGVDDVAAIKEGLKSGVLDCIASDHAPHTENEKEIEFDRAEFGVTGLETELSVAVTELIETGVLQWPELVAKMSVNPSKILGLKKGTLSVGADADIVVVDPKKEWKVSGESFVSKSKNSAFIGRLLKGQVVYTLCAGQIAYQA
jgi:dihydroorotase